MARLIHVLVSCLLFFQAAIYHHFVVCVSGPQSIRIESTYQAHCCETGKDQHNDALTNPAYLFTDDCAPCLDKPLAFDIFIKNKTFNSQGKKIPFGIVALIPIQTILKNPLGTAPQRIPASNPSYDPSVVILRV